MNPQTNCKSCGNPIPSASPAGVCPKCTFALAMGEEAIPGPTVARPAMNKSFIAPRPEDLQPRFPNLEIIELLGQGGMGAVYKARQKNLDRLVALKILSPGISSDPSFAQRFTREARTLAKLSHPNIVMVFEFGTVDDLHYLLMEFVDGVDLRTAMREGNLKPDQALPVVQKVCEALQYAHDNGIVHRDIKPENILLGRKGNVKIADFGLAKLVQSEPFEQSLTGTQQVVGTRNYMAPEQIETPTRVDHRADIYSLGVVFYELLTGELPLGRFAAPSEKANVSARLDDVVLRALEKEPDLRFQQASHVQTAVQSIERPPEILNQPLPEPPRDQPQKGPVLRLPFTIPQMYHGFATAHGIAHFDGSSIELEFEVKDDVLGAVKSRPQRITIPVNELIEASCKSRRRSARLTINAAHLETVGKVPNNEHGQFVLHIKKENREQAESFAEALAEAIQNGPGPAKVRKQSPIPPKSRSESFDFGVGPFRFAGERTRRAARNHDQSSALPAQKQLLHHEAAQMMRGPALGLLATGVINALVALGLSISFILGTLSWVGDVAESVSRVQQSSADTESTGEAEAPSESNLSPDDASGGDTASINNDDQFFVVKWIKRFIKQFSDFSFGKLIFSTAMALVLIVAATRMMQLKDFEFCFFAAVLAVIPFHSATALGIGFGIWALVMLTKDEIKEAFSPSPPSSNGGPVPPAKGAPPANPVVEAIQAPAMVLLQIFKTLAVIVICLLFSFGLILLVTKFAANKVEHEEIRPEFRESVSQVSDRIDEFENRFEQQVSESESEGSAPVDATILDEISGELEKEFQAIRDEINELKKTAESTAEFEKLNSRSNRLTRIRKAIASRIQSVYAPSEQEAGD